MLWQRKGVWKGNFFFLHSCLFGKLPTPPVSCVFITPSQAHGHNCSPHCCQHSFFSASIFFCVSSLHMWLTVFAFFLICLRLFVALCVNCSISILFCAGNDMCHVHMCVSLSRIDCSGMMNRWLFPWGRIDRTIAVCLRLERGTDLKESMF